MNDTELVATAVRIALLSEDPSTQNGAFIADITGTPLRETFSFNGLPRGVIDTPERWERPTKYAVVEHAERNAIYSAARNGICTEGLTLVAAWAACTDCARAIIQAGIARLLTVDGESLGHWEDSIALAMTMLGEAGVQVEKIPQGIPQTPPLRRNGVLIYL